MEVVFVTPSQALLNKHGSKADTSIRLLSKRFFQTAGLCHAETGQFGQ